MQKVRTRYFHYTFRSTLGFSTLFLGWLLLFGKELAEKHFQGVTDLVFSILMIAAGSFLLFSFVPFFKGDKRWFLIPALLTVVFFVGAVMLWQVPVTGVVV